MRYLLSCQDLYEKLLSVESSYIMLNSMMTLGNQIKEMKGLYYYSLVQDLSDN